MTDFSKMTVEQLRAFGKENGIKIKSGLKKAEIVEVVKAHQALLEDSNEVEEEDAELDMSARITSKMTVKQMKEFAAERDIKLPSGCTLKNDVMNYVNGYLDELDLDCNPDKADGKIDLKPKDYTAKFADLDKYAKYKDRAWLKHLHVHGWTVVPKVFSDEILDEAEGDFWSWLEGCEADVRIDREDPKTWKYDAFPCGKNGLIKNYIGQELFMWDLRKSSKDTFEEIYRDPKTKESPELVTSFDGAVFSIPTKKVETWFHFDQPRSMDSSYMSCVQGIACLTDSHDEDGGFICCIPKDGDIGRMYKEYHERHPSCGIVWGKVDMDDDELIDIDLVKVNANRGDLILFDSRLCHCGIPPISDNYRMAAYISFQPRDNVEEATAISRIQMFEQGRMTGHWCYGEWYSPQPANHHAYGKKVNPPELNKPDYEDVADMI